MLPAETHHSQKGLSDSIKVRLIIFIFVFNILGVQNYGFCAQGISSKELQNFAKQLPNKFDRIQSLQIIHSEHGSMISLAVDSDKDGWKLYVFEPTGNEEFVERWHSGKLPDSFQVSYPGALKTFAFANEEGVIFEGCAPHACPDVFSILIYVPSINEAFIATSTYKKVTYSKNALASKYLAYKQVLDQLLKNH